MVLIYRAVGLPSLAYRGENIIEAHSKIRTIALVGRVDSIMEFSAPLSLVSVIIHVKRRNLPNQSKTMAKYTASPQTVYFAVGACVL